MPPPGEPFDARKGRFLCPSEVGEPEAGTGVAPIETGRLGVSMSHRVRAKRVFVARGIGPAVWCGLMLLGALAGCSSDPEGPTDQQIQAEMQGLLEAFEQKMKLTPDAAPTFFAAEHLQDFMGIKSFRYRRMGARMLADASWKTGNGASAVLFGVTLVRMDSAEGAKEAFAADTKAFSDAAPLDEEIVPRKADRILAFAYGPYYVTLGDLGESEPAPGFLREAAKTMAELLKEGPVKQTIQE